jgi:outer membrane lipoprotein-sorting protein
MILHITSCLMLLAMLAPLAGAQTGNLPNVNNIVDRMLATLHENKVHLRAFTVKRNYQLLDKQSQPKAELVADITYRPPAQSQYRIERSTGGLGEKVLRDILAKETETAKDSQHRELSRDNYDFQLLREETLEGSRCYVLAITPKREDKELVRGQVWVDAQSYKIHRLEGKPVKSPSWWLRDSSVVMNFAEVHGMWLRTSTQAVANLRFNGRYVMVSRDMEYHAPGATEVHKTEARKNHASLAGAAIGR